MKIDLETIRAAKSGESESMAELTASVNKRVFTYIYRLTLDYHLSEDLAQETVLDLIKFLPQLEFSHINPFWSWLYRTALGKIQHHFRFQGNKRVQQKTIVDSDKLKHFSAGLDSGINKLMKDEMRKAVTDAMQALRIHYRNILTLRCFENLSYSEIAAISGGSELQARLLFFRAKRSLRHQLTSRGFKKEQFLSALGVFGLITAGITDNAAAATTVSATSLAATSTVTIFGVTVPKIAATVTLSAITLTAVTTVAVREYNNYKSTSYVSVREYINPEPHPFADLLYLLENDEFSSPTEVTSFNDPGNDGFRAVDLSTSSTPKPFVTTPTEVLVENPKGNLYMFLPRNHWVEVAFDGPIIDSAGTDLFYAGWRCRTLRVVLIGEQGQERELEILNCLPDCPKRCFCLQIAPFDIAKYNLDFQPVRVRLQGIYGYGARTGFQLSMVRARIAK
jgi:RNA polymerase sigma-70 factor (ECF subfamily)